MNWKTSTTFCYRFLTGTLIRRMEGSADSVRVSWICGRKVQDIAVAVLAFKYPLLRVLSICVAMLGLRRSEAERANEAIAVLRRSSIITVSDISGIVGNGGSIGLVMSNKKISLEINNDAAHTARITVDPRFLQIARVINTPGNPSQVKP